MEHELNTQENEEITQAKRTLNGIKVKMAACRSLSERANTLKTEYTYYNSPRLSKNQGGCSKPRPINDKIARYVAALLDQIAELQAEKIRLDHEIKRTMQALAAMPTRKYQRWLVEVHIAEKSWRDVLKRHDRTRNTKRAYLEFWRTYSRLFRRQP